MQVPLMKTAKLLVNGPFFLNVELECWVLWTNLAHWFRRKDDILLLYFTLHVLLENGYWIDAISHTVLVQIPCAIIWFLLYLFKVVCGNIPLLNIRNQSNSGTATFYQCNSKICNYFLTSLISLFIVCSTHTPTWTQTYKHTHT